MKNQTYQTKHFKAYPKDIGVYWLEFGNGCRYSDICTLDDGYWYYWPCDDAAALEAHRLREIADILDMMNKEWDDQVNEYFENNPDAAQYEATDKGATEAF